MLLAVIEAKLDEVYTSMPGKVVSFDGTKASVKPLIKVEYADGTVVPLPVIHSVPIVFPRTSDFALQFPIKKDDYVLILFSSRPIGNWLLSGKDSLPESVQKHSLNDAIAIPGLFPFTGNQIIDTPSEDVAIKFKGQEIRITKNGDINVGKSSLKALVNDTFMEIFNTHTHDYIPALAPAAVPVPTSTASLCITNPVVMTTANLTTKTKAQ